MQIRIVGFIAGSLHIAAILFNQITAINGGYWNIEFLPWLFAGLSLGGFIILLSTKLKI
jgi:hypothetical protein|tara:strand:+ start:2167 stop:2343 length:177 start_codon:yes stop_codon:yes gene_type:complete